MVDELTREIFEKHVGEAFTVHDGTSEVCLRLLDAVDTQSRFTKQRGGPQIESFAIHFAGPASCALPQAIYQFQNSAMGTFELFMVPVVSHDPGVMRYEAIINRLVRGQ